MLNRIRNLFKRSMATRQRYFINQKLTDSTPVPHEIIPKNEIRSVLAEVVDQIETSYKPVERNGGNGLYLGTAGVAYMFYHLSKVPALSEYREQYLKKALQYLEPALTVASVNKSKDLVPSFILGNCGVYAVASAIYMAIGDETQSSLFKELFYNAAAICKNPNFLSNGSDELFVGRAGYVLGALWLAKETNTSPEFDVIYNLLNATMKCGREYARGRHSRCPLMYHYYQVEYLGAAHGLSSILQALLSVPEYLQQNRDDMKDVRNSLDYLLSIQSPDGNFPATTDEIGYPCELVHWCHGAAGTVYLMAKAYIVLQEEKYLRSCIEMADLVWEKGLLKKGPGLCHGVAGNGYVFLLLYRMTQDQKYLSRAVEFYKFMNTDEFQSGARTPDYPYSLFEGLAGTACYLADLIDVDQASFPFFDVFYVP